MKQLIYLTLRYSGMMIVSYLYSIVFYYGTGIPGYATIMPIFLLTLFLSRVTNKCINLGQTTDSL